MTILASIAAYFLALLKAVPPLERMLDKYFPAKTTEQKVEEGQKAIDDEIKKEEETGRPS